MSMRMVPVRAPAALRAVAAGLVLAMLAAVALVPAPLAAQAVRSTQPLEFRDRAEEQRFHELTAELRCVMCQNQSLADSDAPIAHDLRREVFNLMREGRSDAEIKEFLVQRPAIGLGAGGIVGVVVVRRRAAANLAAPRSSDEPQEW